MSIISFKQFEGVTVGYINPFRTNASFQYSLKTLENLWLFDVFWGIEIKLPIDTSPTMINILKNLSDYFISTTKYTRNKHSIVNL